MHTPTTLLKPVCAGLVALSLAAGARPEERLPEDGTLEPSAVEGFFDAAFALQRHEHELAGAIVSVVQGPEVVLEKGYGYANLEDRVPADPGRSLFRIASITKTFVWTAVMQLVERGELRLDEDLAAYLDFPIPPTFDAPITLEHLLTHTPGFEEKGTGTSSRTAEDVLPLREYLTTQMPARVRPPGEYTSYSNYGTALAGYVVERVSGMPWQEYIEGHILRPLGMDSTTLRQPVPEHLESRRARGYKYVDGRFEAQPFLHIHDGPAGIISTTASDMAAFMIAHLQMGRLGDSRILANSTAERMRSELFRHHPSANPFLHGFYRSDRNGVEVFGHGGDVNQFHSDMVLFPEHQLGLFFSYNSDPGSAARSVVVRGFIDHFFPVDLPPPIESEAPVDLSAYAGEYAPLRRNSSTFEKLGLLVSTLKVRPAGDGQLVLSGGRRVSRWASVGDDVFRALYSDTRLAFERGPGGQVTHAFISSNPTTAYDRLTWYQSTTLHGALFGAVALIAAIAIPGYAYRVVRRAPEGKRLPRPDVLAAWAMSLLNLYLLLGLYQGLTGSTDEFAFGLPRPIARLLTLGTLSALLSIPVAALAIRQWVHGRGGLAARARYGVVALSGLTMLGLLSFWKALGLYL